MPFPPVNPSLERALAAQGYAEPTPVQAAVMVEEAFGRDLLVSAQTGSGKTVAYGMAFAATLLGTDEAFGWAGPPLALIIAPTRELALQVSRELGWLYAQTKVRIVTCVGGMDARAEQRQLANGAHIVVGTPGRLRDHTDRGNLDLSNLKVAVLDEADEMLDLGFREDLEAILDVSPPERQTLLFSATIARDIATLAKRYQNDALRIDTVSRGEAHVDIEYRAIRVAPGEVEHALVNVLRFFESSRALVFCGTREGVRHLNSALRERGFATVALSGELTQKERTDALQALRDGHARVCVATDVAARGLDLPNLDLVVHSDLPANTATLLHRSGRTGRAGRKGTSVILATYPRMRRVQQMLAGANIEAVWQAPPKAEEIRAGDQRRLLDDPILTEAASEDDLPLAKALLENRSAEDIAMALIRLHRSRLPEPEEVFDGGPANMTAGAPPRGRDQGRDADGPRESFPMDRPRNDHVPMENAAWFRLSVGRSNNADPKWILPLICRMGHVTKKDIGQIRIFDRDTRFEIARDAEVRFLAAVAENADDKVRIEPAAPPPPRGERPPRPEGDRPQRAYKPRDPVAADFAEGEAPAPAPAKAPYVKRERVEADGPRPERPQPSGAERPRHDGPKADRPFDRPKPAYVKRDNTEGGKPPYAKPAYAKRDNADGAKPAYAKPAYARRDNADAKPAYAKPAYPKRDAAATDRPKAPYVKRDASDGAKPAYGKPAYAKPGYPKRDAPAGAGAARPAFKKAYDPLASDTTPLKPTYKGAGAKPKKGGKKPNGTGKSPWSDRG